MTPGTVRRIDRVLDKFERDPTAAPAILLAVLVLFWWFAIKAVFWAIGGMG